MQVIAKLIRFIITMGLALRSFAAIASDSPLVIAHRGASGLRPEHTAASYELAIEQGADFIEADLVITKDNVLIVRHENEISSTTDVAEKFPKRKTQKTIDGKKISGWFAEDFSLKEIRQLRARERLESRDHTFDGHLRILTLDEFLDLAKRESKKVGRTIGVYIETKHPSFFKSIGKALEPGLAKAMKAFRLDREVAPAYLQSFELSSLEDLKKRIETRRVFLMDEQTIIPADFVLKKDQRTYGDLVHKENLKEIRKVAHGIGPYKRLIVPEDSTGQLTAPRSLVQDAHDVGLFVHPFTFRSDKVYLATIYKGDAQNEYKQFFDLGVDGVFTDFPADAIRARKESRK